MTWYTHRQAPKKRNYAESNDQQLLIRWLSYSPKIAPHLVKITNEGKRSITTATRLKREGLRAGFPDLFLFLPNHKFHGLAIEMKTAKGRLTTEQKEYQDILQKVGYAFTVAHSWINAADAIIEYLEGSKYIGDISDREVQTVYQSTINADADDSGVGNHITHDISISDD